LEIFEGFFFFFEEEREREKKVGMKKTSAAWLACLGVDGRVGLLSDDGLEGLVDLGLELGGVLDQVENLAEIKALEEHAGDLAGILGLLGLDEAKQLVTEDVASLLLGKAGKTVERKRTLDVLGSTVGLVASIGLGATGGAALLLLLLLVQDNLLLLLGRDGQAATVGVGVAAHGDLALRQTGAAVAGGIALTGTVGADTTRTSVDVAT